MKNLLLLLFLAQLTVACNKSGDSTGTCTPSDTVTCDNGTDTDTDTTPITGDNGNGGTDDSGDGNPDDGSSGDDTSGNDSSGGTDTGGGDPIGDTDGGDSGDSTIPTLAETFGTNVTLIGFSGAAETKMLKAIELIKLVVATEEFRKRVINHTYNGVKTYVDNRGHSNEKIYQMILEAAEELQPTKNNVMDVEVELYTNNLTSTVGYTYSNSKRIWVNTKYFNTYTAASVANNLFHEWLHKLGYGHAASYSTSRDYSVPYAVGDIMGELARKFL